MRPHILAVLCLALPLAAADATGRADTAAWSPKASAAYLDGRMSWWMTWPSASRDHETFCVSCHTVAPYAMGRPALRTALGESEPSALEQKLLANITKRVRMWDQVQPFYPSKPQDEHKTVESRGTEAVLNALILVNYKSGDAGLALKNMWAQQLTEGDAKGAFPWLQFHNAPWEGDSQYYGATLAAIAVGNAPENERSMPEVRQRMEPLRGYLRNGARIPMDRVMLLWASAKWPELLSAEERRTILAETYERQQTDGGFSLSSFSGDWKRRDNTPLETKSDGYATGLISYALLQAGVSREEAHLSRSLGWLSHNQDATEGRWLAYSLNKKRDLSTDVGQFMSDAATAYAVLALQGGR